MIYSNVRDWVNNVLLSGDKTEYDCINIENIDFPVSVLAKNKDISKSCPLVIFFHGSINRETQEIPVFEGKFTSKKTEGKANVVSVADPTLAMSPILRTTWYAGAQDYDVPGALRTLIKNLIDELKPSRTILCGGSTGAHPALYQASFVPNGVAVVCNPIGCISQYYAAHINEYRSTCWPEIDEKTPLKEFLADMSVSSCEESSPTTFIILSNARDSHLVKQSIPITRLLISKRKFKSTIFITKFFSKFSGHSYSSLDWLGWINAAINSPTTEISDIGSQYEYITGILESNNFPKVKITNDEDFLMAQSIYEYEIARSQE